MQLYNAFGISMESGIPIPQFVESNGSQVDVSIRFDNISEYLAPENKVARAALINEWEICFYWKQIGWFLVRNGSEILIEPEKGADEKLITLPLVGVVLATLLHQRGLLVLHASAVGINEHGVAFLGQKGKGKSTTAALLYRRGHPVISDDILAISFTNDNVPSIIPGFPNFKLLPDTIHALGDDLNSLSECYDGAVKRYSSFSKNFPEKKLPLKAVFCLDEGDNPRLVKLEPQQAITALMGNTYLARYGNKLFSNAQVVANLKHCSNVVNHASIYNLERPKSFHLLEDLAVLIEQNAALPSKAEIRHGQNSN